jgi:DNA ligase-1
MLAENFYDSTKQHSFTFPGDSGRKSGNTWIFTTRPTQYAIDPSGWIMSEKLDGVRAFWDATKGFRSRNHNQLQSPEWFARDLYKCVPKGFVLDGELHVPDANASTVSGILHRTSSKDEWSRVQFYVFDVIGPLVNFAERSELLKEIVEACNCPELIFLPQTKVRNMQHAYQFYKSVVLAGGEGVVLKNPNSLYEHRRSSNMLKWKPVLSSEAKVVGFNVGAHQTLGSFQVALLDDPSIEFKLAGKMSKKFREQYVFRKTKLTEILSHEVPHLNDIVGFEYMNLSSAGVPRQAVFIGKRLFA